jgi:multidrug efflux pump subunit AcrB
VARPVRLVLGGPDYEQLRQWRDIMLAEMEALPELLDVDSNYQERKPQFQVRVDRDLAAVLGVSLADVGSTLETMMGSRIVTTYIDRGREYNVILQGRESDRVGPDDLANLYVRSAIERRAGAVGQSGDARRRDRTERAEPFRPHARDHPGCQPRRRRQPRPRHRRPG